MKRLSDRWLARLALATAIMMPGLALTPARADLVVHIDKSSPMPRAIFFHGGFAIHGTCELSRLGGPASHGCVRLHPSHAAALFSLVEHSGRRHARIEISN
jgi:hypothetical protein